MSPEEKLRQLWSRAHCPEDAFIPTNRIIRAAIFSEREECAKLADRHGSTPGRELALTIRQRAR